MKISCPTCGATLDVPSPEANDVRCTYCGTAVPRSALVPPEQLAAERLGSAIGAKLEAQAERSRAHTLRVGAGIASLVVLVLVVVSVRSQSSTDVDESSSSSVQQAVEEAPIAPPPVPEEPPALPEPAFAARVQFGGEGTGEGRISDGREITVDAEGTVYVADRTNRIQAFDSTGRYLRTLSVSTARRPTGPLDGDITQIEGLAATRDGKLWVSIGYDLLRIDATTGHVEHTTRGANGRTCFRDLSVDPRGDVYARSACTATNRYSLIRLDANGRERKRVNDPPDYDRASSGRIAVDGAGRWYVPYSTDSEVRVLEPNGEVFTRIGRRGDGPGEFDIGAMTALSLDAAGRLYVRDAGKLEVFAADGHFVQELDIDSVVPMRSFAIGADGTIWVLAADGRIAGFDPLPG